MEVSENNARSSPPCMFYVANEHCSARQQDLLTVNKLEIKYRGLPMSAASLQTKPIAGPSPKSAEIILENSKQNNEILS